MEIKTDGPIFIAKRLESRAAVKQLAVIIITFIFYIPVIAEN